MAFQEISNVKIAGIASCVPRNSLNINEMGIFSAEEAIRFSSSTGVHNLPRATPDISASDLVYHAAERLLSDIKWNKADVDLLIFVSQTPDYILPATSCILQNRLGLKEDALVLDISLGCSGWIYGLLTISNFLTNGNFKKGLLLTGDTISKTCSSGDKSTFPLFGDAGAATAIEYSDGFSTMKFHFGVDGSGSNAIIIPEGGYRNQFSSNSFVKETFEDGIERAPGDLKLEGMDVFSFGISKAPESVNKLLENYRIPLDKIDYFIFHQANLFMNEKIRKKLKIPAEKVPYSLSKFGNTSSATIPLTITSELGDKLINSTHEILACGFGVGLSWGSVNFKAQNIVCSPLLKL